MTIISPLNYQSHPGNLPLPDGVHDSHDLGAQWILYELQSVLAWGEIWDANFLQDGAPKIAFSWFISG